MSIMLRLYANPKKKFVDNVAISFAICRSAKDFSAKQKKSKKDNSYTKHIRFNISVVPTHFENLLPTVLDVTFSFTSNADMDQSFAGEELLDALKICKTNKAHSCYKSLHKRSYRDILVKCIILDRFQKALSEP